MQLMHCLKNKNPAIEKEIVFKFLLDYFGYVIDENGLISKFVSK